MSQDLNVVNVYTSFIHVLKDLDQFADTNGVKLAFDGKGSVYVIGNTFNEPLKANFQLPREVREAIHDIIAKHCPRIYPAQQ